MGGVRCGRDTPLHFAASRGNTALCMLLLHHGASVAAQNTNGATPLHVACGDNQMEVALLCLRVRTLRGDMRLLRMVEW